MVCSLGKGESERVEVESRAGSQKRCLFQRRMRTQLWYGCENVGVLPDLDTWVAQVVQLNHTAGLGFAYHFLEFGQFLITSVLGKHFTRPTVKYCWVMGNWVPSKLQGDHGPLNIADYWFLYLGPHLLAVIRIGTENPGIPSPYFPLLCSSGYN